MINKNQTNNYDVIVIGAGAAGLLAAGRAAHLGAKVLLMEKMSSAGRKMLITGKGRCNITNKVAQSDYFKNIFPAGRFLKHAFSNFFTEDIIKILNDNGVETITERGNRAFPRSDKASDVLNGIMKWMGAGNIEIIYNTQVSKLLLNDGKVTGVKAKRGNEITVYYAANVILCTGGKSYPATGSSGDGYELAKQAGHTIDKIRPALVPLITKGDTAGKLQGLSLKNAKAIVWINGKKSSEEFGEMMFTHQGLTGPIILTLSGHVVENIYEGFKVELSIDLKPALDEKKLDARLLRDINSHGKKQVDNTFKLWLPSKLIPVFIELLEIDGHKPCNQLSSKERKKIRMLMKNFRFMITGHAGFDEAIITAGGVKTTEINSKTMESKLVEKLFFAGEIIDLHGNTGGFNLQIAFSTGWLAGQECLKETV